jgi:hypothetical protein
VPAAAQSGSEKPKATEIGVSATEIHIAVLADVDNPFAPGLFQGSVDGVKGAVAYLNSKAGGGGVAGRKLVVDFIDTHVNAHDSRNGTITACQNDLAMVGGAMVFLTSVDDIINCKDQVGQVIGIPDMGGVVTSTTESCAPTSFPAVGVALDCATKDQSPQTYRGNQGDSKWLLSTHKGDLHGSFIFGNDTKDSARGGKGIQLAAEHAGIKFDQDYGAGGRDPQSALTSVVQKMKSDNSNYSLMTHAANIALQLRSEAQLQSFAPPDMVWNCVSCYGNKIVKDNPEAFEGEYQALSYLPFDETSYNKTLAAFIKYVGKDKADQFSVYSWIATLAFAEAAKATVAKNGINGLTRKSLNDSIRSLTDFDAGGMAGVRSFKTAALTPCFVEVQFKSGKWVRVYPTKKGTMDCKKSNAVEVKADLLGP